MWAPRATGALAFGVYCPGRSNKDKSVLTIILIKVAIVIILIMVLLAWALLSIGTEDAGDEEDEE